MDIENQDRNPDLFLKQVMESEKEQSRNGKLKIFFGYAAGIGKTYAMLSSAHQAKEEGIDVVAGYIEPHTRPETMELTRGLEMLPVKEISYKNITLKEFDLEQALKRKPELILVDELAHTNAEGCRHEKRYQDIKELLKAGINVYTTVNVQHLESLNDTIAGITGVTVRERIPDAVFDDADQVKMVDIEPEELLERMRQGKIYREHQANRAMYHFFTKENLAALREIALRRMADRVNLEQETMTGAAGETADHILTCLSASPSNGKVIRQAARMAAAFHGKFTALYVETPGDADMTKADRKQLGDNIRLAEQLGARVVTTYGSKITEEIAAYAKVARVSKIVLGRTYTKRRLLFIKDSFSEQLSRLAPSLEVFLIPDAYDKRYRPDKGRRGKKKEKGWWQDAGICAASMVISTLFAFLLNDTFEFRAENVVMVYLVGVLMTAVFTSRAVWGIVASMMSILVFNYYFTEPYRTLHVNDSGYMITFAVMFLTALVSSALARKLKEYASQNARKAYRTEILFETSHKLQDAESLEEIAGKTTQQLGSLLERNLYFYLGKPEAANEPITYLTDEDAPKRLDETELAVAQWTYRNNKHAGCTTQTLPGAKCLCLAVRSGRKVFAVVAIDLDGEEIPAFEEGIMSSILNECAFALEKEELLMEQKEADVRLQKEKLRANLLRSISHDLRTPLTSISGNAETLMMNEEQVPAGQRHKIYHDIYNDSMWLINLVENLLSVTRIENGSMELNIQGEIVEDVIEEALRHVNRRGKDQDIQVDCEELLLAKMDVKLMIQVLINLVDNAVKYTPDGSVIRVTAKQVADKAVISVTDTGAGVPAEQKEKLFQMFYSGTNTVADGRRGMGLGLALCQAIVNAHGGKIRIYDNVPHGTIFRFELEVEDVRL